MVCLPPLLVGLIIVPTSYPASRGAAIRWMEPAEGGKYAEGAERAERLQLIRCAASKKRAVARALRYAEATVSAAVERLRRATPPSEVKLPESGMIAVLAAAEIDPFQHYMSVGWRENRDPNKFFSSGFYSNFNALSLIHI